MNLTTSQLKALLTQWATYPMDWPHFMMALIDIGLVTGIADSDVIAALEQGEPDVTGNDPGNL